MSPSEKMQGFLERAHMAAAKMEPFGKTVMFDFGEEGKVYANARQTPVTIEHGKTFKIRADGFVRTKISVLERLIAGDLDPMKAMFSGRLKVSGDMNAVLELAKRMRASDA